MSKDNNIIKLNPELAGKIKSELTELNETENPVKVNKKGKELEPAIYVTTLNDQAVIHNETLAEIQYMIICEEFNIRHSGDTIGRILLLHNTLYGEVRVIVESFTDTHIEPLFHTYQQTVIKKVESGEVNEDVVKHRELHVIYTIQEGLPVFSFEVTQMKPSYEKISIGVRASFPVINRLLLKRMGGLYS